MRATAVRLARGVGWFGLLLAMAALTWSVGIADWAATWGATLAEVDAVLPGDELIEQPAHVTTRAVTMAAPPEQVWPWVAQFGQGRGGLYSYDWLEQLIGVDVRSTTRILDDEQDIAVGDRVWVTQPGYPADLGLVVADVRPGEALVLYASTPKRPSAAEDAPWTWTFSLRPDGDKSTRLVVRNRYAGHGVIDAIVGPVGFTMERKTLTGIQQRAEAGGPPAANADRGELVWFTALLGTGLAIIAILASRRRPRTRILRAVPLAVAATLVLLRIPFPVVAVALGAVSAGLAGWSWATRPLRSPRGDGAAEVDDEVSSEVLTGAGR